MDPGLFVKPIATRSVVRYASGCALQGPRALAPLRAGLDARDAEKAREAMRRWRQRHPERHAADSRARYARDPAKFKRIIESSPNRAAVRRAMRHRRRARTAGKPSFTAREWADLVQRWDARCSYCGAAGSLQVDHRTPLARGGPNTIDNILPACGPCNLKKRLMTEEEFRAFLHRDDRPDR